MGSETIPCKTTGRYLILQLQATNSLQLAEVRIYAGKQMGNISYFYYYYLVVVVVVINGGGSSSGSGGVCAGVVVVILEDVKDVRPLGESS